MAILKLATYMKSFFSRNHIDLDRISNNCEIICCNLYREHGIINHENILKEAFYIAERSWIKVFFFQNLDVYFCKIFPLIEKIIIFNLSLISLILVNLAERGGPRIVFYIILDLMRLNIWKMKKEGIFCWCTHVGTLKHLLSSC